MSRWEKDLQGFIEDVESNPSVFSPEWDIEMKTKKGAFTMRPKNGVRGIYAEFENTKNSPPIIGIRSALFSAMSEDRYEIAAPEDQLVVFQSRSNLVLPEGERFTHGFGTSWDGKGDVDNGFFGNFQFKGGEWVETGMNLLPVAENNLERRF